jgi:hypothetical protein
MHMSQSLFYLTTAVHVSGIIITHLQKHKTTVTTASSNRYPVLLSVVIVEELEWYWFEKDLPCFVCVSMHSAEWDCFREFIVGHVKCRLARTSVVDLLFRDQSVMLVVCLYI